MKYKNHVAVKIWSDIQEQIHDGLRNACIEAWNTYTYIIPRWTQIALICVALSILLINLTHVDMLIAPVIKTIVSLKGIFIDPLLVPLIKTFASISVFVASTAGNWWGLVTAKGKNLILLGLSHLSLVKLEIWLGKKGASALWRFALSTSLKWIVLNILITQAFGNERRGIKRLPIYILYKLKKSRFYRIIDWWRNAGKGTRQIVISIGICFICAIIGQALLGFWILAFDIALRILVYLWEYILKLWRLVLPIIQKHIPNVILGFVSRVMPSILQLIPFVKNDVRVLYVEYLADKYVRKPYRMYKKSFLIYSRSHKIRTREKTRNLIPDKLRSHAKSVIVKSARHKKNIEDQQGQGDQKL